MRLTLHKSTLHALLIGLGLCVAQVSVTTTHAAPPGPGPRPLVLPWTSSVESHGVDAITGFAAGLGFLDGWELGLAATSRLSGSDTIAGVAGLGAFRLGPLAFGTAFSGIGDGPGTTTNASRLDLALALRLSDHFALGLHHVDIGSGSDPDVDNYSAWSLSSSWRPTRGFSLALSLEELDSPVIAGTDGLEADPIARLGLGFRPGTERVTFGLEASRNLTDDNARWSLMANSRLMALPGLWLGGWVRHHFGEEGGPSFSEGGITLGFSQGGLELSTGLDVGDGDEMRLATLITASSSGRTSLMPRTRQVVRLQLSGDLPERPGQTLFGNPTPGFAHWLMALDMMADDDRVAGILLQVDQAPNWAQCWELRQALTRFKQRGKKVLAVLTFADMRAYYLASIADEIHLYAAGGLILSGLAITQTYWFSLMEKLGIKADLVRYADYKSATEPFTRTGPSDPAREQTRAILDGVNAEWFAAVSLGRRQDNARITATLESGPQPMKVALDKGLVDGLVEGDALGPLVEKVFGKDAGVVPGYAPRREGFARWGNRQKVAIIPVVGSIVDGSSAGNLPLPIPFLGGESTGDTTFVASLDAAMADPDVVAVVVRVDSGGGSALASDKMHRAVVGAAKKKPLVVSFGNVAASGGYYLAAGSKIYATPVTVTGSIGIFAGKVDLAGLFSLIGLSTHTEKTHPRADAMSPYRPFTDEERDVARQTIRAFYDRFLGLVAEGRKMDVAAVEAVAGGRVWLGGAAHDKKLVDEVTGLWDAVSFVAREAGYDTGEFGLGYYGGLPAFSSLQRLIGGVFFAEHDTAVPKIHPELTALSQATLLLSGAGPLALLPTQFDIR